MILNIITGSNGGRPPLSRSLRLSATIDSLGNTSKCTADADPPLADRPPRSAQRIGPTDRRNPADQPSSPPFDTEAIESNQRLKGQGFSGGPVDPGVPPAETGCVGASELSVQCRE
jgi:hypothetical protein